MNLSQRDERRVPRNNGGQWFFSLRVRLLATLAFIQITFVVGGLAGLGSFLEGFFAQTAESQAAQLGQTIKMGLRQAMLRASAPDLRESLADLGRLEDIARISVINKNGRIVHATDRTLIGAVLDRERDPECTVCHTDTGASAMRTAFVRDTGAVPVIRHVDVIQNEQQCWNCHDSESRVNGIILVEQATETFEEALTTVRRRLTFTGAGTLVALLAASFFATTILILRPVRRLMIGVTELGAGDLTVRVPISGRGELTQLSAAFNEMAGDLGRSIEETRNKTTELSVLYSILERVAKSIELTELKDALLQAFLDAFQADQALLVGCDAEGWLTEAVSKHKEEARTRRVRRDEHGHVSLPPEFPADVVDRWRRHELRHPGVTSNRHVAMVPIDAMSTTSFLLLVRRTQRFSESETHAKMLAIIAEHVGIAFQHAQLYTMAITDELTQLFTVRHLHDRLDQCVFRHARDGQAFSLLMIDLDRFKRVNDRWGHPAGDAVLTEIAHVLRRSIRVADSGYRYGGDELVVLLPETDFLVGKEIAERLLREIDAAKTTLSNGEVVRISASIGIATYPNDGTSASQLIAAADAALYNSKRDGRGRAAAPSTSS